MSARRIEIRVVGTRTEHVAGERVARVPVGAKLQVVIARGVPDSALARLASTLLKAGAGPETVVVGLEAGQSVEVWEET